MSMSLGFKLQLFIINNITKNMSDRVLHEIKTEFVLRSMRDFNVDRDNGKQQRYLNL